MNNELAVEKKERERERERETERETERQRGKEEFCSRPYILRSLWKCHLLFSC